MQKDVKALSEFMNYNNYGGAVLLGCTKNIVKAHGSCESVTILHCIEQAYNMEKNALNNAILNCLQTI